mmetsp:Transcript_17392/g.50585  ORF Transcript_17392/g.50585 Transcript_17392/m.50585 type:complete len:264 (-) Transcript_17392:9367-10158(-)
MAAIMASTLAAANSSAALADSLFFDRPLDLDLGRSRPVDKGLLCFVTFGMDAELALDRVSIMSSTFFRLSAPRADDSDDMACIISSTFMAALFACPPPLVGPPVALPPPRDLRLSRKPCHCSVDCVDRVDRVDRADRAEDDATDGGLLSFLLTSATAAFVAMASRYAVLCPAPLPAEMSLEDDLGLVGFGLDRGLDLGLDRGVGRSRRGLVRGLERGLVLGFPLCFLDLGTRSSSAPSSGSSKMVSGRPHSAGGMNFPMELLC